jgi:hypothetical protein
VASKLQALRKYAAPVKNMVSRGPGKKPTALFV